MRRTQSDRYALNHAAATASAAMWARLVWAVRLLVVLAHRVPCVGVVQFGATVRAGAEVVGRLGERVLEVAQPLGREIEGFHEQMSISKFPAQKGHTTGNTSRPKLRLQMGTLSKAGKAFRRR
ncbi:hypothetical protein [Streptomyces tropicalis]|uniref:Secreted protein n=1 Tax=Streptomyces tropicalis TaxID=3034234 RepID=A0ABT6ACW2_9ACTN|nr:hypothetical protein [Streptomyces tropicalis]MDF3302479.1 hypothetical protein [Streptomyces tropicalis]